ncbi:dihydroxyacetone kinase subunit DhaL [Glycomyces sp. NPDC047010]|uniref:dihydroxyacetone kinase subunit DhaL n=1 Tax=Glycomyces sp. NPDC047010 TaxID=3155023 RepID=UPI0033D8747D
MTAHVTLPVLTEWLAGFHRRVVDQERLLTELDSAIGDADHGSNMVRGMTAVMDKVQAAPPATVDALLKSVGMTLVSSVGGASGPLYGTFFLRMGTNAGAVAELDAAALGAALRAGLEGVVQRGKPELGDKTMYDALAPALDAYDAAVGAGKPIAEAAADAAAAAAKGRDSTRDLVARKGRASYLGERSAGHLDPGSASAAMLMEALAEAVASS